MTAANKYPCRLDGREKDCINDPLEAEGGKGKKAREDEKRKRSKLYVCSQSMCPHTVDILWLFDDSDELSR